jgi:ParB-like chromosome segregation protein Spo0J
LPHSAHNQAQAEAGAVLKDEIVDIADIYVPAKRRKDLDEANVAALAESILEEGMKVPIQVRKDGGRFVLVAGLHRLEACRALGEEKITCIFVAARKS